jgi:hypothetical protein
MSEIGFLKTILGGATPKLVFSSNVTPKISLDLEEIVKPGGPSLTSLKESVEGKGKIFLKLIKPEIIIRTFGVEKSYTPYGKPYANMPIFLLGGICLTGILGASIAWYICRNKII